MKIRVSFVILFVLVSASEPSARLKAQRGSPAPSSSDPSARLEAVSPSYNQLVSAGYDFLKAGELKEAYVSSMEAAKINPSRFEAYALAGLVASQQGNATEAKAFLDKAIPRAPSDKKARLDEIARTIAPAKKPNMPLSGTRLYLKNSCSKKIYVALTYHFDGDWLTSGWWNVDPGQTTTSVFTTNQNVYLYAYSDDGVQWDGGKDPEAFSGYTVGTKFTMATDFPFSGGTPRMFFHRTIPAGSTNWTTEFSC